MLNGLLRTELAALNAYQLVLRSPAIGAAVGIEEVRHLASEHQRTVTILQWVVREMGGVPASEGAAGAFSPLRDVASVRDLLDGEEAGLRLYRAAVGNLDGDARDLVTFELIPRQLRQIAELTAIMSRLGA